jgi:hypothetical protein
VEWPAPFTAVHLPRFFKYDFGLPHQEAIEGLEALGEVFGFEFRGMSAQ